jgi:Holliday junction resolvase RusA-like endonuclease
VPVAWSRAESNGSRRYNKPELVAYEQLVAWHAKQAMGGAEPYARDVPLSLLVEVVLPIPASWTQRKWQKAVDGLILPTARPDSSNLLKAIEDGMQGVAYADDAAIVHVTLVKRYGAYPCVMVDVSPIGAVLERAA